jgi:hypothetical protein
MVAVRAYGEIVVVAESFLSSSSVLSNQGTRHDAQRTRCDVAVWRDGADAVRDAADVKVFGGPPLVREAL